MRNQLFKLLASASLCLMAQAAFAGNLDINEGRWSIKFDDKSNTLEYLHDGTTVLKGVTARATDPSGKMLTASEYGIPVLKSENILNAFGNGIRYTYTYAKAGSETIEHSFLFFPGHEYFLTEAFLVAGSASTSSNHLSPLYTSTPCSFLPAAGDNRVYTMPFDNDAWRTYSAKVWSDTKAATSYEVGAWYDVASRKGLVAGSIEHFQWKTGVVSAMSGANTLSSLEIYGGIADEGTNDAIAPALTVHGHVKGEKVKSPLVFVGLFDDWRVGLETIGEATAILSPKLSMPEDLPSCVFGYQSWGEMAEHINFTSLKEIADFFESDLAPEHFCDENGVCWMCMDSFWSDNLTAAQARQFAMYCEDKGYIPGLYGGFFSLWWDAHDYPMTGTDGKYKWGEAMLTANGQYRKCGGGSYCIDPTHPGTEMWIRSEFKKWRSWGYRFVKIDFMSNGAVEADKWYLDSITTGIAAFNYGMDIIVDAAGDDFVLDFSISPVFPNKTHARRSGCDTWKSKNDVQYCLTNQSLGWWLDRVYTFNDPDHLCLRGERNGINRMRYMNGIMNGFTLFGDDFSYYGDWEGKTTEAGVNDRRKRAKEVGSNSEINAIGRLGRSFRPLEGNLSVAYDKYGSQHCDDNFILDASECVYLVHYNFKDYSKDTREIKFSRIGIDPSNVASVRELWTGIDIAPAADGYSVDIPASDVSVIKITKKQAGIGEVSTSEAAVVKSVFYDIMGRALSSAPEKGVYLRRDMMSDGTARTGKFCR